MQINILLLDTFLGLPCWLLWLLASLLSALLGYLIGRAMYREYMNRAEVAENNAKTLRGEVTNWEAKYRELQYKHDELDKDKTALRAALNQCEADKAALSARVDRDRGGDESGGGGTTLGFVGGTGETTSRQGADYAALLGEDNLQVVEGIGPKIEQLLKNGGYPTWAALADAEYDNLRSLLDNAGPRYRIHDPKTWPEQASLAAAGKWTQLIEYQKFLSGGQDTKGSSSNTSKLEKLIAKKMGYSTNPEDLKVVEGVGPKIEGLMKAQGINTWADLAATSVDRLQEILADAGERYRLADPSTWPRQAELAANGNWDELRAYQDQLSGGKDQS